MAVLVAGNRERGGAGSGVDVEDAPVVPALEEGDDRVQGGEASQLAKGRCRSRPGAAVQCGQSSSRRR